MLGEYALPNYLALWVNDQDTRKSLINRIKQEKNQANNMLITERRLGQEYYRAWLDQPIDNPLQRLLLHPLFTKEDEETVNKYTNQQKINQAKFAVAFTGITIFIYTLFFRKNARFQRFFNNRRKSSIKNWSKKITATYLVLQVWIAILNSHYQKKIPQKINQMGIFKKYGIVFEQKNV